MSPDLPHTSSGATVADVIRRCCEEARRIATGFDRASFDLAFKGRGNVVTAADTAVEEALVEILRDEFPGHAILAEESLAETRSDGWMWVIDPIDGTKNFSVGVPFYSSTIALCHNGQPVAGGTIDLPRGEFFYAEAGKGLTIDGVATRGSVATTVYDSVVGMDLGYSSEMGEKLLEAARKLYPNWQALRITGSAALGMAQCAAGRFDIFLHCYVFPWDIAAGLLLVREGGGKVIRFDRADATIEDSTIICGSAAVIDDFLEKTGLA
jgi:fructose-1,6-bisphosphatase/inositol monophosphatase family enzyme